MCCVVDVLCCRCFVFCCVFFVLVSDLRSTQFRIICSNLLICPAPCPLPRPLAWLGLSLFLCRMRAAATGGFLVLPWPLAWAGAGARESDTGWRRLGGVCCWGAELCWDSLWCVRRLLSFHLFDFRSNSMIHFSFTLSSLTSWQESQHIKIISSSFWEKTHWTLEHMKTTWLFSESRDESDVTMSSYESTWGPGAPGLLDHWRHMFTFTSWLWVCVWVSGVRYKNTCSNLTHFSFQLLFTLMK